MVRIILGTIQFRGEPLVILASKYTDDTPCPDVYSGPNPLAIVAETAEGDPYAVLSINAWNGVGDGDRVQPNEFVVSNDVSAALVELCVIAGFFEMTTKHVSYGYVRNAQVFRLTKKIEP